ncbi:MAG TPA: hypothetical protein VFG50_11800 [Rhodothermales bacterium]|nr:hypothetical protein [Rhodothermales bacterium]
MSRIRVKLDLQNIDERQEVDALEANLKKLNTVEIHELGLSQVDLSFNQNEVDISEIELAVEKAGGAVQEIHREE